MTYKYEISVYGRGGEFALGTVTKEQYNFWKNDNEVMSVLKGFENAEDAFADYIIDTYEYEDDESIPEQAKFDDNWHEHDDIYHMFGANYYSSWINIVQLGEIGEEDLLNETMEDFCENIVKQTPEWTEDPDYPQDGETYVLESVSSEKGQFIHSVLEINEPIDFTKFKVYISESYDDETLVSDISYNDEPLENEGGDTNGKGLWFSLKKI